MTGGFVPLFVSVTLLARQFQTQALGPVARRVFVTLCALFAAPPLAQAIDPGPPAPSFVNRESDLAGQWEFMMVGQTREQWFPARVPGCVHTDMMAIGLIPDPFVGRNENEVQWIEDRDWVYRKRFNVSKALLGRRQIDLVCEGLDTLAVVKLNGTLIGQADNMFRRWTFPVGAALREGENVLEITFVSPKRYIDALRERLFGPLPATNDPVGGSPYVRKAPYQFGWDWAPRLTTCGIWRPIRIVAYDEPRVEYVTTRQRHDGQAVELDVTVELRSPTPAAATLYCAVAEANAQKRISVPAGISSHTLTCHVANPKLWYPAGHGEQKLYDLLVQLTPENGNQQTVRKRIGFRTVALRAIEDVKGASFTIEVNDRPIFCKGANWIPCDSFPTRVGEARYRRYLEDAAACNMNMIRVWGGGIYEDDAFYDSCDELGLMVWQDFMFSCSLYPASKPFLENVRAEAEHNVKRLMNHPSIVLYCGNNECETAIKSWYKQLQTYEWENYRKLFHELLPEVCVALDPDRPYWPSSPHSIESTDPGKPSDGDTHAWDVWHGSQPFESYQKVDARFVSEYGFQSFPPMKTIVSYAGPEQLNLTAPDMEHHQKNFGGNTRILTQMTDRFRFPTGFKNFVILSQLQQALAMQIGAEHWRRSAPDCMGILFWQLDDCWPVASWSAIDYFGRWKALPYFARRFYEPLHASAAPNSNGKVELWISSDVERATTATLEWQLQTYTGVVLTSGTAEWQTTAPASVKMATIPTADYLDDESYTAENCYLTFRASDGTFTSRNVHHLAPFKTLSLPKPYLNITTTERDGAVELTVSTDVFAKWVWIEAEGEKTEGRFSDNFFDLDPGETRTITYSAPMPARFVPKSLVDTYQD